MSYDNWKLANGLEDEKVICNCDYCGGEIYKGEEYSYIPMFGEKIHEDCVVGYLLNRIDRNIKVAGEE